MKHLIFFDGECGLCHTSVRHIISMDKGRIFSFAPLEGRTAEQFFLGVEKNYKKKDSLVLVEDYPSEKIWIQAQAVARIYWLLGGIRKVLGVFCFFPSFFVDPFYQFIATHRHRISERQKISSLTKEDEDRFLP